MSLLKNEQIAKDFVIKIGEKRATRLLNLVTSRIARRIRKGNEQMFGQFLTEDCVRKAPWEVNLTYNIKMGLSLTDTYNTPIAAKQRIASRIAERNARRALRLQSPQVA